MTETELRAVLDELDLAEKLACPFPKKEQQK